MVCKNIAALEVIPYPPKNLGSISKKLKDSLKSTQKVLNFVEKLAERKNVVIVVKRQANVWRFSANGNASILKLQGKQAQSASLNPKRRICEEVKEEIVKMIKQSMGKN